MRITVKKLKMMFGRFTSKSKSKTQTENNQVTNETGKFWHKAGRKPQNNSIIIKNLVAKWSRQNKFGSRKQFSKNLFLYIRKRINYEEKYNFKETNGLTSKGVS